MKPQRQWSPSPHTQFCFADAFWKPRLETNRKVTLPAEYEQCKKTGRLDAFKLEWKKGDPNPPHIFWDSDVAKWIEAAAFSLATHPDTKLEALCDEVIDWIAKAQQPDGYLNVHFTIVEPEKRWTNLRDWHELYCAGHLMEAAVAYFEATGKRKILDVLSRYADYIATTFGTGANQKRGYPGHPELELALVKLYRATKNRKYLELSKYFVDERGQQPHYYDAEAKARDEDPAKHWTGGHDYYQAHLPLRKQKTAEGHSVRALYLYAGMADVALETRDEGLWKACLQLWKNITLKRMYVTGGIGSARHGERFSFDYDLPNETAYAETCANIALMLFAHRLLQADLNGEYADVMERALYNSVISGVSKDGKHFFYENYLAACPPFEKFARMNPITRQEWFGCACCPPNIARLLASLGLYLSSESATGIAIHLYAGGRLETKAGGMPVAIDVETNYPWDGAVKLNVSPKKPVRFTLALRIPGWCRAARLKVNGTALSLAKLVKKGYALVTRDWALGDRVELELPMPVERVEAHPSVREDCGLVALQRGPLVYCVEEADCGRDLADLVLPAKAKLTAKWEPKLLGGVVSVTAPARRRVTKQWGDTLYRPAGQSKYQQATVKAIPYALWANRKAGEMRVWLRAE
jgi:hypothetical protein